MILARRQRLGKSDTRPKARLAGWSRFELVALTLVTSAAAALRLVRVTTPHGIYFDEFYATDACWYVKASASVCGVHGELTPMHPPLGKWLIGVGIVLFGYRPLGWRTASVVAGTLTVVFLYVLARRLLGGILGPALAAALLAVDFLHFVQSRAAMLDVFLACFVVAAFLFALYDQDRDRRPRREPSRRWWNALLQRRWRLAAGAAAGGAVSTKWSGLFVLLGVLLLTVVAEFRACKREAEPGRVARDFAREAGFTAVALLLLPAVVYVASYAGRLDGSLLAPPWQVGSWYRALIDRQAYMFSFQRMLGLENPYESPAWSWFLLKRPVVYYIFSSQGQDREVLAVGNPLTWWPALLAVLALAVLWIRRPGERGAEGVVLLGFIVNFVPWLVTARRPMVFMFYLLPAVPFMCLALAFWAVRIPPSARGRSLLVVCATVVVASFAFYYPVLAAVSIAHGDREARILFHDCRVAATVHPSSSLRNGGGKSPSTVSERDLRPPGGWCWE
jgi:dolichyl-phosphate-mannose--protein O-mannosyl transferase